MEPTSVDLSRFKQALKDQAFGKGSDEIVAEGSCRRCHQPAGPKCYSDAGRREFQISGICERCFDAVCDEEEE